VSISRNVNIVAVGSSNYDKIGENFNGMVRVFDFTNASNNEFVLDNFKIYPNPASDILNISLESNLVFEKAVLYNNLGQIVKEANQEVVDVSALAKGIYFVEVTTNQGKATKKVIIK
ncbi:MAG: T9SS type A sorting domain-containing protein, partial [Myroides sp.]